MKHYNKLIGAIFSMFVGFSYAENVTLTYDDVLDGVNNATYSIPIDIIRTGNVITGDVNTSGVISGFIEEGYRVHYGSGSEPRFNFTLSDNNIVKWFSGSYKTNGTWSGAWFGANSDRGDFSFITTSSVPEYKNILSFTADSIFSGGKWDYCRDINESFLSDIDDKELGIYCQSDNGGLPFPMSFMIELNNTFTLQSFKLGSYNNGQGTRLTSFNLDVWENGNWVSKGSFSFNPISGTQIFERQEFALSSPVSTNKFRISATGTSDEYAGGRVLIWGLSFH